VRPETAPTFDPRIRRAAGADLENAAALFRELLLSHAALDPALRLRPGREGEIRRLVREMLGERGITVFLGFAASAACASGLCAIRVDRAPAILQEQARAEVTELYVREEMRRQGLGTALARAALAHARELGVRRLEVRVLARNLAGQAFWRALGFSDFMDVLDLRL
jgi:shikimate dehydrogenase